MRALLASVDGAHQQAVVHHLLQSIAQNVVRDRKVVAELVEATGAGERLTQDQHDPWIAEYVEGASDRAGVLGPVLAQGHGAPPSAAADLLETSLACGADEVGGLLRD